MTKITQITYGLKLEVAKEDYAYENESDGESESIQEAQFAKSTMIFLNKG
jgi:hypothetical protein